MQKGGIEKEKNRKRVCRRLDRFGRAMTWHGRRKDVERERVAKGGVVIVWEACCIQSVV